MKHKFTALLIALSLITTSVFAVDKFDSITTNSPTKLKVDFLKGINFTSTDSLKIPVGTTGQRDASPSSGMLRLNSTTNLPEVYYSAGWKNFLTFDTGLSVPVQMDMNSHKIVNLTDPSSAQDAATKNYVDTAVGAIDLTNYVDRSTTQSVGGNKTFSGNNTFNNTITGSISGNAATVTTNANLTGEVTSVGNAATLTNSAVIGKVLTGFTSGAGVLAATDTILQAIQKLDGNVAAAGTGTITGPIGVSGGVSSITSQTGTGTKFVVDTSPTLVTPNIGVATATSVNGTSIPSSKTLVVTTDKLNVLASTSSSELAGVISDESGTGSVVYSNSPTLVTPALGTPSALVGTNITGTAAGLTAGTVTTNANLTGEVVSTGNATTVTNAAVIAKTLSGYTKGAGNVSSSDSILSAVQKLDGNADNFVDKTNTQTIGGTKTFSNTIVGSINGNAATVTTNANLTGAVTSSGNATSLGSFTSSNLSSALSDESGTGAAVFANTPTLVTPVLGAATGTSLALGGSLGTNASLDVQGSSKFSYLNRGTSADMAALTGMTSGAMFYNNDLKALATYNGSSWDYGFGSLLNDSEWVSYPCVITGFSTSTSVTCQSRRVGDSLEMRGSFVTSTPQAVAASISIGYNGINGNVVTDASKMGSPNYAQYGTLTVANGGLTPFAWSLKDTGGNNVLYFSQMSLAQAQTGTATTIPSGSTVLFNATGIPIVGFSGSNPAFVSPVQQVSSDTMILTQKTTALVSGDAVGTFTTYIKNGTSAYSDTICTSAPTQSIASMNTDGLAITGKAYNTSGNCNTPSRFEIKLPPNLKDIELQAYSSTGKASGTDLSTTLFTYASGEWYGPYTTYNATTGILGIELGNTSSAVTTARSWLSKNGNVGSSVGYVSLYASLIPSISSLPLIGNNYTPGISNGTRVDDFSVSYGTTNMSTVCSSASCFIDQIGTAVLGVYWSSTGIYSLVTNRTYAKLKCSLSGPVGTGNTLSAPYNVTMSCSNCNSVSFQTYTVSSPTLINTYGTVFCKGTY